MCVCLLQQTNHIGSSDYGVPVQYSESELNKLKKCSLYYWMFRIREIILYTMLFNLMEIKFVHLKWQVAKSLDTF